MVQGQGKADLSLSGGRASVVGAVIGALIFGVLRNAPAQIPGGTFADRLILGVAVLAIVVLDRAAGRRRITGLVRAGASTRSPG